MTKFAAYDKDAIFGVADTREAALAAARREVRDDEARFKTAPISDALAAEINENGWDGHRDAFAFNAHGYIVRA